MTNRAYLLTGGNIGERTANLAQARTLIERSAGIIRRASALYETAAWGKTDQPAFLNQALEIETTLSPSRLMQELLEIEKSIGRLRKEKYGPRLIDIDILLIDDLVLNESSLILPHPQLANRRFALTPLAEIAPDLTHPVLHQSIQQLLTICPDQLKVAQVN